MFVTHDRYFLNEVSTRIIELDRGKLKTYPGCTSVKYFGLPFVILRAVHPTNLLVSDPAFQTNGEFDQAKGEVLEDQDAEAVSYTHLTLPTNREV